MSQSSYQQAQRAMADLKASIYTLLDQSNSSLSNAEIGRALGIYAGHKGHEGHISRTLLSIMEAEGVVEQEADSKKWQLKE